MLFGAIAGGGPLGSAVEAAMDESGADEADALDAFSALVDAGALIRRAETIS